MGVVFRMGVPFAQISDGSLARRPSSQCNGFVAEWHSFEKVAKPLVQCGGNRCLLDEHVSSMDRTELQPASFAVRITRLNMPAECLQRRLREMQQRSVVVGRPRTRELHNGHSRSFSQIAGRPRSGRIGCVHRQLDLEINMTRRVFYSFHYAPDNWRASQVRNIGVVEGNQPAKDNDWEIVTKGGDKGIEKWIADQMDGRSCVVVLISSGTANRKWINHEIVKAWNDGKGILGVHVHNLKNREGKTCTKGANPFDYVTLKSNGAKLSTVVKTYDPPGYSSTDVYAHIKTNLELWIEAAIASRTKK